MNHAQALRQISKLKGRLKEQLERASGAVTHGETQAMAYGFESCREEASATRAELLKLQTALAVSNARAHVEWTDSRGKTGRLALAFAVRLLAEMKSEIAWLKTLRVLPQEKVESVSREHDGEKFVRVVSTSVCHLPEAKRNAAVDALQDDFDRLNDAVNQTNGQTEIAL